MRAGCFEARAHDLRAVLRLAAGKNATPESGGRAGFDGAKKRKDSKVQAAVDTRGHLLALKVTATAQELGLRLEVVKHHEAKHGFVLRRRGVVERTFAWAARPRRLVLVTLMLPLLLAKSA